LSSYGRAGSASVMRQDGLLGELRKVLLNRLMANSNIVRHRTGPRAKAGTVANGEPITRRWASGGWEFPFSG
jgi:hypothetical protein